MRNASSAGALGVLLFVSVVPSLAGSTLDRPADPVVLTGAGVPLPADLLPAELVAFRYDGGWQQIPLQVDERSTVDWGTIYNTTPFGISGTQYTDAGTFTGPDIDPRLDDDDEIVFMASQAGAVAPLVAEPVGTLSGTGVELVIVDPLDGGLGHVYLFRQDGTLDPAAGGGSVVYQFELLSGDYLTTYNLNTGPNPEDSTAVTPFYAHHFSDRWIDDELRIFAGGASGVDVLDRHKNQFAPGNCARTEDTFSAGEGAFVVNRNGPVRALRSYLGANSGPLTQREHVFYERRHDIRTFLRVHVISGVVDYFDYSPAASGMTYANDLDPGGVPIDGNPDSVTTGRLDWELVDGDQGSVVIVHTELTDIDALGVTSYYLDDSTPPVTQCTGDGSAYGSSGPWVDSPIPCTDPALCPDALSHLTFVRTLYYGPPGVGSADAASLAARVRRPLEVTASAWGGSPGEVPRHSLSLAKSATQAGEVELSWGPACSTSATSYALYEGELGSFASHVAVDCAAPGTSYALQPSAGDRYYLVVPVAAGLGVEGSYGVRSDGSSRPPAALPCWDFLPQSCP